MQDDLFYLLLTLAFFALTWGLVRFCASLERGEQR
jgi:hypothetical protein